MTTAPDFETSMAELRALALEVRSRYELMLMFDLDLEDAALHRELVDQANEVLEDIAMAEAGRGLADAGPPLEAERPRPTPAQLWAEWTDSVRFQRRSTLSVPCTAQLLDVLATAPRSGTVMVINETTGRTYRRSWFADTFRALARAAGIRDDLQFRDLRRTSVVRLAEAGCSVPEIAAISGHAINRTAKILEVYLPRNSTMARHAITRLEDYRRTQHQQKLEG